MPDGRATSCRRAAATRNRAVSSTRTVSCIRAVIGQVRLPYAIRFVFFGES